MSQHNKDKKYSLNAQQQRAVETIDGPVMVIAGPGTGKTQVLSARIAQILKQTDMQPQNILALTFTESAAHTMRQRLVEMIGPTGMFAQISTFHSFCQSVLREFPDYFFLDRDAQPLTDSERYDVVEHILDTVQLETLKPLNQHYFYLKDILKVISDLKREGVGVEKYRELVTQNVPKTEKILLKQRELAEVYAAYETELKERKRYDFDDMIALVNQSFSQYPDLLSEYQERLQYILVDEYQDTNTAQNQLVFQLASFWGEAANIFVVGDPHQSIYRFQGASTENIFSFAHLYPKATVITLNEGYRCPQVVYDAAYGSMQLAASIQSDYEQSATLNEVFASLQKPLKRVAEEKTTEKPLIIWSAQSQTTELCSVAEKIQQLLSRQVSPSEIAILYRTNREAVEATQVLQSFGIPYFLEAGGDALNSEPIKELLHLFTCVVQLRSGAGEELLFQALSPRWMQLDALTLFQLVRHAARNKMPLSTVLQQEAEILRKAADKDGWTLDVAHYEAIRRSFNLLIQWGSADSSMTLPELFSQIITESGFMAFLKTKDANPAVFLALKTVFDHLQRLVKEDHSYRLADFLKKITVMQSHGLTLPLETVNSATEAVCLSTVHKAKGREWEYVFIIHCIDGVWGNGRSREMLPLPEGVLQYTQLSKKEKNDDDRRLFYVAMTRAKKQVSISFPQTVVSDTKTSPVTASLFVHELKEILGEHEIAIEEKTEAQIQQLIQKLVAPLAVVPASEKMASFFKKVVTEFKLSVTALNNYLKDPEYFVYNDLLKLPQAKAPYLAFGTAVHSALENVYKQMLAGNSDDLHGVAQRTFEQQLVKEIMTADELPRRLAYGREVLSAYLNHYDVHSSQAWQTERVFGSGFTKTILDDIPLTGRIDRFDWVDTEQKLVRVVDYKTGAAKTVNEIEGKTQSAGLSPREKELPESIRGAYKRQLLFYKLLTELDQTFKPAVVNGVFDFIEPDKTRGTFVQREFELLDADVKDLKELVRVVMKEIRELKFLEVISTPAAQNIRL